jgi:hypothetical protein
MQRSYLFSEARSAVKWAVIALSVILLSNSAHASALGDLVARERANRDNESAGVGGGFLSEGRGDGAAELADNHPIESF